MLSLSLSITPRKCSAYNTIANKPLAIYLHASAKSLSASHPPPHGFTAPACAVLACTPTQPGVQER